MAHKRCSAWGEVKRQRMRDMDLSVRKLQASVVLEMVGGRERIIQWATTYSAVNDM